jgi:hypothetical protein
VIAVTYDDWVRISNLYGLPQPADQHEAPDTVASPFWHEYGPSNDCGRTVFDMTARLNVDIDIVYREIKANEGKPGKEVLVRNLKDGLYRLYDLKKLVKSAQSMFAPVKP